MCLIGEGFDDFNDYVCGAFVVIKKSQDRIGIWTKEASNRDANMHIGYVYLLLPYVSNFLISLLSSNVIKKRTNYNGGINFEAHDSSKTNFYQV